METQIEHEGVVQKADNKSVTVKVSSAPACGGCRAEKFCNVQGAEDKIIQIFGKYIVNPGDTVTVLMKQSSGYSALLLGYVFPLLIVILILFVLMSLSVNELTAGLLSIGILIPYYFGLFVYRKNIDRKFTFKLKT